MENPYQTPESRLEGVRSGEPELAGRGARFGAAFLDGLISAAVLFPMQLVSGYWGRVMDAVRVHESLPATTTAMWALAGAAIYIAIQAYPLITEGQTWGKKAVSIRIVSLSGEKPTLRELAIRYGVLLLPRTIPTVGGFFSLINICLIFRSDKRCGHDLAAGTRVIVS